MHFRYNSRSAAWYLNVGRNGTDILTGVHIVNSTDLLAQFVGKNADLSLPIGTIVIQDSTGADRDPDINTFGDEVTMLYEEAA